jgi:hypothetical protein
MPTNGRSKILAPGGCQADSANIESAFAPIVLKNSALK